MKKTPITLHGSAVAANDFRSFMEEWSLSQAEANHVETIDEANDFAIDEDDEDILHPQLTVYEMHEAAEDNLQLLAEQEAYEEALAAESNETVDGAQEQTTDLHDQSAPVEPDSPPESASPLSSQHNPTELR